VGEYGARSENGCVATEGRERIFECRDLYGPFKFESLEFVIECIGRGSVSLRKRREKLEVGFGEFVEERREVISFGGHVEL